VQIETQARVNQDPSPSHLPATAWPRQMLAVMSATQHHLPMEVGRGDYDQHSAGAAPSGHKGLRVRTVLSSKLEFVPEDRYKIRYQHPQSIMPRMAPESVPSCLGLTGDGGRRSRVRGDLCLAGFIPVGIGAG